MNLAQKNKVLEELSGSGSIFGGKWADNVLDLYRSFELGEQRGDSQYEVAMVKDGAKPSS